MLPSLSGRVGWKWPDGQRVPALYWCVLASTPAVGQTALARVGCVPGGAVPDEAQARPAWECPIVCVLPPTPEQAGIRRDCRAVVRSGHVTAASSGCWAVRCVSHWHGSMPQRYVTYVGCRRHVAAGQRARRGPPAGSGRCPDAAAVRTMPGCATTSNTSRDNCPTRHCAMATSLASRPSRPSPNGCSSSGRR